MSLILEALRKLEREKQTPERGFLVLGPGTWSERTGTGRPIAVFFLGLLLGAVALGVALRSGSGPAEPAAAVAAVPTAAPPAPHAVPPLAMLPTATAPAEQPIRAVAAPVSASPSAAAQSPAARASAPAFTLQAISEKDGHTVALINDRLLRQGDAIDGARVVAIAIDSVELEIGGRRVVLRF